MKALHVIVDENNQKKQKVQKEGLMMKTWQTFLYIFCFSVLFVLIGITVLLMKAV